MIKILCYTENYEPGGGNRYMIDFINYISQTNEIILLCNNGALFSNDRKRFKKQIRIIESKLIQNLNVPFILIRYFIKIIDKICRTSLYYTLFSKLRMIYFRSILKKSNPSHVIAFNGGFPGGSSCFDICRESIKMDIVTYMSIVSIPYDINHVVIKKNLDVLKKIFFIVNCEAIKNMVSHLSRDTYILYNKLESAEYPPLQKNTNNVVKLGYIGRVEELKGITTLLNTFISMQDIDIELHLYGKVNYDVSLYLEKMESFSNKKLFLHGFFNDISTCMSNIDIFIFPSYHEGLPFSILESMYYGIPCITTNVGGIPEIITDNETGILVEPKNEHQLLEKIMLLITNKNLAIEIGQNAKKYFELALSNKAFNSTINQIIK